MQEDATVPNSIASPRARRNAAPATPVAVGAALLARSASQTLAEQLAGHYAARIRQRLLLPGARLPSVRESARRHRVSPSTVVAADDQLLAQGLVEAKRQRGFFVRGADVASHDAPPSAPRLEITTETAQRPDRPL